MKRGLKTLWILALVWFAIPVVFTILWGLDRLLFPGVGVMHQSWILWLGSALEHGEPYFWLLAFIWAIVSIIIVLMVRYYSDSSSSRYDDYRYSRSSEPAKPSEKEYPTDRFVFSAVMVFFSALLLFSAVQYVTHIWNADKVDGRYYNSATTFYTPSLTNYPESLHYLMQGARPGTNGCNLVSDSDVPTCIKVGTLSSAGFQSRVSSATGALFVMQRTSGSSQNVNLLTDTLTYLNGAGKDGVWSAIRDGSGNITPMEGVVEWPGVGNPTECTFTGRWNINRAINGAHGNSLSNLLAATYPQYYWTESDVWGYCKGNEPIVVFPVERQVRFQDRVLDTPAGVIIVTGSSSGKPQLRYEPDAVNLPGPVYPTTIADQQLNASSWSVGRLLRTRTQFGYEPTDSAAQNGNVQDYLLKSNADGHLYWVTPLTLRGSESQLFVAYSMVRADVVHSGQLNPFEIYVLGPNDIRRVNIDSLEAQARDFVSQQNPGFFSSGGQLVEFTPTVGDVWRAFGELNGRVVYRLDISASNAVQPDLVSLESFNGQGSSNTTTQAPNANCGEPPTQLTQAQIVACLKFFAGQLGSTATP